MAWPRLRNRRRPAPQVTSSNGSGATPDATGSQDAAQDGVTEDGVTEEDAAPAETVNGGTAPPATADASAAANGAPAPEIPAAWEATGFTEAMGAPLTWPSANGAAALSPADAPETAEHDEQGEHGDVPFWDWAPADELTSPDESGDTFPDDEAGDTFPDDEAGDRAATSLEPRRSSAPVIVPVEVVREEPQREGIGQHLGNLAHLSADSRMRAWQRRAIIAVVVGVVFTIVVSWRWGLTLAVLAAIADTIYRSRTTFTGEGEAQLNAAQRRTRRQLGRLERSGYRAMNNVHIPGSEDQIDHLVVGRAGVFAIDSEAWDRRLPLRPRLGKELWLGPHNMQDRVDHARWESERAAELLSGALGSRVTVRPAMAVYGPKMPWPVVTIRDVDVFRGQRLRKYLRGRARQNRGHLLSASDIERIDKTARRAFPRDASG